MKKKIAITLFFLMPYSSYGSSPAIVMTDLEFLNEENNDIRFCGRLYIDPSIRNNQESLKRYLFKLARVNKVFSDFGMQEKDVDLKIYFKNPLFSFDPPIQIQAHIIRKLPQ